MPAEGASNAARRRTGSPIRGSRPDLGRRAVRPRLRRRPSGSGPGPRGAMTTCSAPPGWTCRGAPLSRARRFDKSSKYHQKQQAIVPRRSDTVGAVQWRISSRTRGFPRGPENCSSPGPAPDHVQRVRVQISYKPVAVLARGAEPELSSASGGGDVAAQVLRAEFVLHDFLGTDPAADAGDTLRTHANEKRPLPLEDVERRFRRSRAVSDHPRRSQSPRSLDVVVLTALAA
jgi:hypothetical protein